MNPPKSSVDILDYLICASNCAKHWEHRVEKEKEIVVGSVPCELLTKGYTSQV